MRQKKHEFIIEETANGVWEITHTTSPYGIRSWGILYETSDMLVLVKPDSSRPVAVYAYIKEFTASLRMAYSPAITITKTKH